MRQLAKIKTQPGRYEPLVFWGAPKGILETVKTISLTPDYARVARNFLINEAGFYEVRPGLKQVTASACGAAVKTIAYMPISGTFYTLLVDADNKLYACTGSEPELAPGTAEATLEGAVQIVPFHGQAVILDGSYIKYFDGTSVEIAYDDGYGPSAYQHDATCQVFASAKARALYNGGTTKAGAKFTTQGWDSGYTIDLTQVTVWLKKTGSPTGNATVEIYSDDSGVNALLATSDAVDVSTLTTNFVQTDFAFSAGDVSMTPETAYYAVVSYSGGDADNNITVAASAEAAAGDMTYYDGTWNSDTSADALLKVKPGKPPKAAFGDVKATRLYVAGSPDNPGYVYFSNANSLFDWSTPDAAGYVSAVDDNASSFPVGAVVAHYGDLYVFGKQEQPYLCKLTGSIPAQFALPPLWQKTYTDPKQILSLPNDIWVASGDGLNSLAGVQQYGDLRIAPYSQAVSGKFNGYWDTDAFIGFEPQNRLVLVKLSGVTDTYVCHLKQGNPWTTFRFGITPTAFHNHLGRLYVGDDNGHLYKMDPDLWEDDGDEFDLRLKSGMLEQPFGRAFLDTAFISASEEAASFDVQVYKNGSNTAALYQSWYNNVRPMQRNIHVMGKSIQVELSNFNLNGRAVIHSLTFMRRRMTTRKAQ